MNLQWLLDILKSLLEMAESVTPGSTPQMIEKSSDAAISIIEKVMAQHQANTGQPLDLSKLHQITPLDQPDGLA